MPIDAEDIFNEERRIQINELFAEGKYIEGIRDAVVAMENLVSYPEKSRYYLAFCKLATLGYRKIGNFASAIATIKRGIKYVNDCSGPGCSPQWDIELAILRMNLGAVYDSSGHHAQAIRECVRAERIFERLNDYHHLMKVYETEIVSFLLVGNYDKARGIMKKIELLSGTYGLSIDPEFLAYYSKEMEKS